MRVYIRWNDKVTYFLLIAAIIICFGGALGTLLSFITRQQDFLEAAVECAISNNYQQLINLIVDRQVILNEIKLAISLMLTMIAIWLTCIMSIIYKLYYSYSKKSGVL